MSAPARGDVNTVQWALSYAMRGWHVFPLLPGAKTPLTTHGQNQATTDPAQIEAWWRDCPAANVGIHARPSGLYVVDVDCGPGKVGAATWDQLRAEYGDAPTYMVRSQAGGVHLYYAAPAGIELANTAGRLGPDIDTRGNGYVVAPPSVVDGRPYFVLAAVDPTPLPGWIVARISNTNGNGRANGARWNAPTTEIELFRPPARTFTIEAARAFCREWVQRLASSPSGTHNHTLNAAAKVFSHFGPEFWSVEEATDVLLAACPPSTRGARKWDPRATIASAYRSAPTDWRAELVHPTQGATFPGTAVLVASTPDGLNLPEEFWSARPELTHIRQAAWSRGRSGDVALHAVLARLAGMWPRGVKLDSGIGSPASANYFAAVVGPSSAGKSTGVSAAKDLLPEPTWVQGGKFADGYPLGSGEGLAEAFMGWEVRPVPAVADPDTGEMVVPMGRDGHPKTERVRAQVRHNALFYMDEGEALGKMLERTGATIGETLRRAWSGATIGQANGRSETTRIIKEGSYSLGFVIGFQPETCQHLLADGNAGTPQRFLWVWAHDRALPSTRVAHPGALSGVWPIEASAEWIIGDGFGGPAGSDMDTPVRYAESIRERLWTQTVARTHGEAVVGELDGHEPLMMVKVSALLAQLAGRREVTEDDWSLAAMLWRASCAVRDHLVAHGRAMAGKAAAASNAAHAEREGAAETARMAIRASADSAAIERAARRLAIRIHERGVVARRDALSAMWIKHRPHFDEAVEYAVGLEWITVDGVDLAPGKSRPS